MNTVLALALTSAWLMQDPRVDSIRVHGNHSIPDVEVIEISGLSIGDVLAPDAKLAVEERLVESGRFETAEVRLRRRGLAPDSDVVVVLLVREKRAASSRFMVGPIFDVSDEYGITVGARVAVVDLFGDDGQLGFPMSFGGKRQIAVEGRAGGFRFDLSRNRRVNPHFDLPDNRFTVGGRYLARHRKLAFELGGRWSDVDFDAAEERFSEIRGGVVFDTRIDPTIPGNAAYLGFSARRLLFHGGSSREDLNQYTFDVRGYKRLWGQALLASQFLWNVSSGPMPGYEQPLLGGGETMRGLKPGAFIGDNRALGSIELRLPFTSPLSFGRAGVHLFYDAGTAYDDRVALSDATFEHAVGVGTFFRAAFIGLRLDVGWNLDGGTRFHIASQLKF